MFFTFIIYMRATGFFSFTTVTVHTLLITLKSKSITIKKKSIGISFLENRMSLVKKNSCH